MKLVPKLDLIVGRILAVTSRYSVDTLTGQLTQTVNALENTESALNSRANKNYSRAAEFEKRGDLDSLNAARAKRVAGKLRALVD